MQIDDETLMALADGELPEDEARRVSQAVQADPELQARLRRFSQTRQLLQQGAPVPAMTAQDDALAARIRAAAVAGADAAQPPAVAPPAPANLNRRPLMAVAAALALAVIGLGWWQADGPGTSDGFSAPVLAALDNLPSGQGDTLGDGRQLTMIASYLNGADELCREFETHRGEAMQIVVACRSGGEWAERFAADLAAPEGFVPASGDLQALDDYLASSGAGQPLTPADEAAALGR